ncbi:MAG: NADH-quinone oxidoreductase subunit L [Polaromonas sp.]|uniref:NADH-quinone oxidoreductase subunit L n=1 Tax=Polaromonas sp. TaxID=1869339 RepID=UPI0017A53B2C|nr:NADH-quinone oxidoreductase subunit L [Polaromonas sp.]NMM11684.1 NADH-quinone oxidoreductase subunit L [Polaromonas sp.]
MTVLEIVSMVSVCAPGALMLLAMLPPQRQGASTDGFWRNLTMLSVVALVFTVLAVFMAANLQSFLPWLRPTRLGTGLAVLVQLLGTVIAVFSSRYLEGERRQRRYMAALAGVLATVHLLLLADHWAVLIAAWALVGVALQHLLCFYPDRPFALLAAYKKRIADRIADIFLLGAAALAWSQVGSGSISDLGGHIGREGMSTGLQLSAVGLVLAVILRTALLPVHGWLIQVMEAPTPVSALLHAGVVNLGGFVLIRFAPLLEQATAARSLLIAFGLGTAVLAGLVMLTRISIKVRLAWSTVAQMGFMVLECGLGLYTLAALHLIGHSLYKTHAFLSASTVVRETRLQFMRGTTSPAPLSLLLAPALAVGTVLLIQGVISAAAWPWWWSAVMGLAWAPLLWLSAQRTGTREIFLHVLSGLLMIAGLTLAALFAHTLPLGIQDLPHQTLGLVSLLGMAALYLCLVVLQLRPQSLRAWRRWSYAGFYVDEAYTRLALTLWPGQWTPQAHNTASAPAPAVAADARP